MEIEIRNVVKQYAKHLALDNVSLNIESNKVFGLLGPNGAGKTTLIRIINQITKPDSGLVLLNGKPISEKDIYRIGYLPEERGLYKKMKTGEQAIYLARMKGLSKQDATKKLKYWFDKFGISEWWDKKVEELSKGMQQKVQFIVTVLHEPELLIFDEPFSGFDPINANILKKEILELKEKGSTVIFSTHNMSSVEAICDNIGLINKSQLVLNGNINDIKQQNKSGEVMIEFEGDVEVFKNNVKDKYIINRFVNNSNLNKAFVQIPKEYSINQFIGDILPVVSVKSFNEILPSMDEVFINTVKGQK